MLRLYKYTNWDILTLYSHHIEFLIILDKVEAPILLLDEEDQGYHWQLRWVYMSAFKVFIQEVI